MISTKLNYKLQGSLQLQGDKSLAHRCLFFSLLSPEESKIDHLPTTADVQSTIRCLKQVQSSQTWQVFDCQNSGTTARHLISLLCASQIAGKMIGDTSLQGRDMLRITSHLMASGAKLKMTNERYLPIEVFASDLHLSQYELKIASAQVKSSLLYLASLCYRPIKKKKKIHSRNHTENLLTHMGAEINVKSNTLFFTPPQHFRPLHFSIPADPSSAAFIATAALLSSGSNVEFKDLLLNPTRIGFFDILQKKGAPISWQITDSSIEARGKLKVSWWQNPLAFEVSADSIPSLIDELPLLFFLATQAEGTSCFQGIEELKHKESNRIDSTLELFESWGINHYQMVGNKLFIPGGQPIRKLSSWQSHDHRLSLLRAIGNFSFNGTLDQPSECWQVSYPGLVDDLKQLMLAI